MKIVFLMTQSLDSPSGLGRYWPLAKELAKMGFEIEVLALHYAWKDLLEKSFVRNGVKVNYVGQMHVLKEDSAKTYFSPTRFAYISLLATWKLARGLAGSNADVIQLCKAQPYNVLAARMSRRGRPVFCDSDDYEAETNNFSSEWQRKIVRYFEVGVIHSIKGLTVNTRFTQRRYQELGYPAGRIVYVPNGVDRQRFETPVNIKSVRDTYQLDAAADVVTYIGTLGLHSHPVNLLLEAMVEINQRHPTTKLLLAGGGEDYDYLKTQAKELGIDGVTIFTGRIAPDEIPGILAVSTITVDPVKDDMIARARSPLKILESLSMGVPVVTGDVGDRRSLLRDGALGRLVSPGNASSLFEGISGLLSSKDLLGEMSKLALAYREEYYWENLVGQFARIYSE